LLPRPFAGVAAVRPGHIPARGKGHRLSDITSTIRDALDAGRNTEALDLARNATVESENSAEIHYLGALASARMGAIGEAAQWLARVDREQLGNGPLAVNAWSLAGRIAKERYSAIGDKTSAAAREQARAAIENYRRAFGISGSAYPAVNAATMAMLSGEPELARTLARQALNAQAASVDYWCHASRGEARLLLGQIDEARAHYAEAHRLAGSKFGDIASMRRQLLLIGSADARALLETVPAPRVIAFSGHMIDDPARTSPRFPAGLEARVASALREKLSSLGPAIGYAQAACGADILFLEAMHDLGMQTEIVLPFAKSDFVAASVRFAGEAWVARFERVHDRAARVVLATAEPFLGDDVLFEHASNLIQGMAFLRARALSTQPLLLTVREPGTPVRVGGTAATAEIWARKDGLVDNIDLAALRGSDVTARKHAEAQASTPQAGHSAAPRSLKSLFFGDISGFSRMPEQYTPDFAKMFLGTSKRILDSLEHAAVDANTRGDGLYVVFDRPSHAAEFAVRLQKALGTFDWPALGLAQETSARIGLHTGPVFRTFDPVMAKITFYGTHVNLAARIEPIVPPGHIFVTEAFAASLVADDDDRFSCHYLGTLPLAKQFGDARLYRLASTTED